MVIIAVIIINVVIIVLLFLLHSFFSSKNGVFQDQDGVFIVFFWFDAEIFLELFLD